MFSSITSATDRRGYDLHISYQQHSVDWRADYEGTNRADGVIFLDYGDYESFVAKLAYLTELGTPLVSWRPGQSGTSVHCDNVNSACHTVKYLLGLGRRKIPFFGDISECSPEISNRYRG